MRTWSTVGGTFLPRAEEDHDSPFLGEDSAAEPPLRWQEHESPFMPLPGVRSHPEEPAAAPWTRTDEAVSSLDEGLNLELNEDLQLDQNEEQALSENLESEPDDTAELEPDEDMDVEADWLEGEEGESEYPGAGLHDMASGQTVHEAAPTDEAQGLDTAAVLEQQVQPAVPAAPGSHAMVGVFGQMPEGYLFVPVANMVAGIDVSHHQGAIDWTRVAGTGIGFAYIKATEGASVCDCEFRPNWAGALANQIPRGAYHLMMRPRLSTAAAQARNYLNQVTLQAGDLPPALDVETKHLNEIIHDVGGASNAWRHIWEWCEIVQSATGYRPLLYLSKQGIDLLHGHVGSLTALELWMPRYRRVNLLPPLPVDNQRLIWPHWTFWQHTAKGTVAGITGDVDLDLFNGNARNLTQWIRNVQPVR